MKKLHNILLAFDSFKGSVSSGEAADAARSAIAELLPECGVTTLNIADGGEGFTVAYADGKDATWRKCAAHDALLRPIEASYAVVGDTAIIELAAASGLTLLNECERNPLLTSTFGTGEMMADAIAHGCRHIVLGIGGSATNDAATGLLSALGYKFIDENGLELQACGENLNRIHRIADSDTLRGISIDVACDVTNPMCGAMGAAHVYAPQKGANAADVALLDQGLQHFTKVIAGATGIDVSQLPGAGAAGGVGGALHALAGASLNRGIDLILESHNFKELAAKHDLIITGEGKIDSQSAMGKTIGGIVRMAGDTPVVALCGRLADDFSLADSGLADVIEINAPGTPLSVAMRKDVAAARIAATVSSYLNS